MSDGVSFGQNGPSSVSGIITNVNPNGQTTSQNSSPVVLASDQFGAVPTIPIFTQDFIRAQSILGHRWGVSTGKIATATNGNVYLVLDLLINNIAKNILIDEIVFSAVNAQLDGRVNLTTSTTLDANATVDLIAGNNVVNLQTAVTNSSSMSAVKGSSGNSAPLIGALLGVQATPSVGVQANQEKQLLQNGQIIYVPAGSVLQVLVYGVIATAGNNGYLYASWLEF